MIQSVEPIIDRLCAAFPASFDRQTPRPLKIGLGAELIALAGVHPALGDVTRTKIRRALMVYTASPAYRKALAHGGPRYGLDGQPAGEVTPEQQASPWGRRTKPAAPAAPPIDWQALLTEVIAMAIPAKLDVTLKLYQLPQARPASSATMLFAVRSGERTVVVELKNKAWNAFKEAANRYPQWVAAITGQMGEALPDGSGFRLQNPGVQVFEKKAKPETASASPIPPAAPAPPAPPAASERTPPTIRYARLSLKGRT